MSDELVLFVLAGDGSERVRLHHRYLEEDIRQARFLDSQPWGRYERMLESADVLLINQRASATQMSLPSKLTSYLLAGKPIVAAVPENSETAAEVRATGAGVVIPTRNPDALVRAVLDLRNDPKRRDELGQRGREFALRYLTPERILPGYDRFVREIAETGP
jgi:glycosyltransferase involved in cell wall biosynthesis